ncbi:hypothetical protein DIURU_002417 [Diutina rugosa]|uniref:ATPase inhibitor, mitochondrial n=1 Tax=Diutina rugosa TaxID=5481 RepID=A0A642UQF0_DIURU|nr:uncharacterized protein DIURU_002417 [Diutina rugosa]KAA8903531.1 hypothetical protein DIURU_002417 [Diutina rugosa]
MLAQTIRTTSRISVRAFSVSRAALLDGSIVQDKGSFSEKERAQETAYIKAHEAEQLKKLRKKLEEQKQTINDLEKEIDNIANGKK